MEMEGVRCMSSSMIQAATNKAAENQRVDLTPWDLHVLVVDPIQKGLLFSKPQTENNLIDHLKTSLSRTLDYFPPLSGRLATSKHEEDDEISFFIDCNNTGALFIHAEADGVTISDILKPVYVPSIVYSFFPLNEVQNYDPEGASNPLLGVQVTELVDGIFIGITINHSVADGTSFWHFLNSWSEISRSNSFHLSKSPIFERPFADIIDYPIRIPQCLVNQSHEELILRPLKERVFHFSKQSIAKLKAKANSEAGTNNISSLQALLSYLWRSVARNKRLGPNEEMTYFIMIGARPRLQNLLPKQYFGNAVKSGGITMKAKELQERGIGDIAREMNRMVATYTADELIKGLQSWIASPKLITKEAIMINTMITSSSPQFDVYGNDFGWGKPIAVRSGLGNKFDGKITVFCGAEEGSIDIEACLLADTLDAMANDQEFMDTHSHH